MYCTCGTYFHQFLHKVPTMDVAVFMHRDVNVEVYILDQRKSPNFGTKLI